MIIDIESSKKLFNYILDNDYEVVLDKDYNNIMHIIHSYGEIKCKYVLIFSTIEETIDDKKQNTILWSYDNQYIDLKTRMISKLIKDRITENDKNLDNKKIIKIVEKIIYDNIKIVYEEEEIIPLWVVRKKNSTNIQYFMIIDIIYL
jgi:hypothetical protein